MSKENKEFESYSEYKKKSDFHRRRVRMLKALVLLLIAFVAAYWCYSFFNTPNSNGFDKEDSLPNINKQADNKQGHLEKELMGGGESLPFGEAKYLIHIHKLSYRLDLYENGKKDAIKRYGIAVARNSGDKQKRGDNRTPTSWGTDVTIPKKYEGAKPNVPSSIRPFEVEEVCEAGSWTHDFNDGKGVIQGAYGPWFISLDTGWDGIGIHGTHDPKSIGTKASEGCIRLVNSDVDELKRIICSVNNGIGTKVIITED